MALVYRSTKGSALTIEELDGNFQYFTGSHSITGSLVVSQNITASNFVGNLQGTASLALTASTTVATTATTASSLINGVVFHGTISSSLIPAGPYTDGTSSYNLGSPTAGWKDLYISNGTIYMLTSTGNSASISYNDVTNTFTFTNSDGLPTTMYDGGINAGAALNYTGSNYGANLYFTGSNFRKTNLCMITDNENNLVNINIPLASNYSPGTVVEFDIIAATGSTWQLVTVNDAGTIQTGFINGTRPGAGAPVTADDYQDFNPFWNNAPSVPTFSNLTSYFPAIVGGLYASGSACIRLIALRQIAATNDTTAYSGSTSWFGRIVDRYYYTTGSL